MADGSPTVRIDVLGRFSVVVGDREIGMDDWPSRRAAELVALLALADDQRLARDRVIEQLWPHLPADAGAANLRKAAHHARRTLGDPDAVTLRAGAVALWPGRPVSVDAVEFLNAADLALRADDANACAAIAATCGGELLPDSPYESWTQDMRRRVQDRRAELLRRSGRWEDLLEVEPTDEEACRAAMRAAIDAGRRPVAIRAYERLRLALARELGARPAIETQRLYERCIADPQPSTGPFVGRAAELAAVAAHRRAVRAGGAAALLVRGPSGIGKSAFCAEVASRAADDGWRIVSVRATSSPRPYGALAMIVRELGGADGGTARGLPERTRAVLAELSASALPERNVTRHQVGAAVQRLLDEATSDVPTMVCVDDAHLLDDASADVVSQMLAADAGPLFLALACRAEWIRTSLPAGVSDVACHDRTLKIDLDRLPDADIAVLIGAAPSTLSAQRAQQVVEVADGNPFFALELARASASEPVGGPLPATVRQAVLHRLTTIDPATFDALTALAIMGDVLDVPSVLAVTGLPEDRAGELLDAALDAGILVVADAGYRFRHELVRQALDDELPAHRRARLHRDAARELIAAGADPEVIADHWLRGQRPDEARQWLLRAARRAMKLGALTDAQARVEQALATAPEDAKALCLRAEVLDALGDVRAPSAYAAAADAAGEPDAQELRARQALAQLKASDPDSALRTLAGVTPRTVEGRLAEALTLSAAAAIGRYQDAETAAAKAREAHELALELGDPGAILDASWAYALAAHARGELPTRLRGYLRATHELPELATRVFDGQLCVTERMLYGGLPNEEITAFASALAAEARRLGAVRGEAFARTLRGEAEILAGALDAADRDFADGARLHGRIGAVAGEALSLLGRAQVALRRGRPAQARPFLREALLMARESEVGHHTLDRIYGTMVEAADDAVAVVCEAEAAIRGPTETCPTCRIAFIVPATIAAARAGDLERAHRYAGACDQALEVVALPPAWAAAVEEARAWVARADDRLVEGQECFTRAAEGFAAWGQPLDAERCWQLARA